MALYRTYRPARLDEVIGQDHVTGPLTRALLSDRVHHAYLFSGPRGCGKTSTARILARAMNCELGPTPDPCGQCQSCRDLAAGGPGSIDVIELDAASHGGVDDTRELRERAMFAPVASRYKVYIIDEAHMVSPQGFNALLKLVEEPPEHVRFIFATTEVEKVIPTIRSRTYNYTFRLVPSRIMTDHLAAVCAAEGIPAEPSAIAMVARAGAGSVRDSLSVLGQVLAGCGPDGLTYAEAVAQLGMTDSALLDETIDALASSDGARLFVVVDSVMDAGHDPRRFATDLLERIRDLIVLQNVPDAAAAGLIDAPGDQIERMMGQAGHLRAAELTRAADVVSAAVSELRGATSPRLHLEFMAAHLLLPGADDSAGGLRARVEHLERRLAAAPAIADVSVAASATVSRPAPKRLSDVVASPPPVSTADPADSAAPPPMRKAAPTSGASLATPPASARVTNADVGLGELRSMWPAILDATKAYSRVAWMVFSVSAPLSLDNGVLAVGVDNANKISNAKASGHDERLRQAILDVVRMDVRIDVVLAPAVATPGGDAGAAGVPDVASLDDADSDDTTGVDLAIRELGATRIGEIEH